MSGETIVNSAVKATARANRGRHLWLSASSDFY